MRQGVLGLLPNGKANSYNPETKIKHARALKQHSPISMHACKECGNSGLCSTCAELWEAEIDLEDMET